MNLNKITDCKEYGDKLGKQLEILLTYTKSNQVKTKYGGKNKTVKKNKCKYTHRKKTIKSRKRNL